VRTTTAGTRALRSSSILILWIASFAVFLWIQHRLSANGHVPLSWDPGPGGAADSISVEMRLSALRFVGASIAMAALILGAGRRLVFGVPVMLTMLLPAVSGGIFDCITADQAELPHGLGAAWWYSSPGSGCVAPFQSGWLGVTVDLGLVLIPALGLALLVPGRTRGSGVGAVSTVLATGCFAIVITFLMSVRGLTYPGSDWPVWLASHLPLLAFGALLGFRRSWWSLALLVVPVTLFPLLATTSILPLRPDLLGVVYLVGITMIGAAWRPLAVAIERGSHALGSLTEGRVAVPAGS
jgi:hypothetical protein